MDNTFLYIYIYIYSETGDIFKDVLSYLLVFIMAIKNML